MHTYADMQISIHMHVNTNICLLIGETVLIILFFTDFVCLCVLKQLFMQLVTVSGFFEKQ